MKSMAGRKNLSAKECRRAVVYISIAGRRGVGKGNAGRGAYVSMAGGRVTARECGAVLCERQAEAVYRKCKEDSSICKHSREKRWESGSL
jgi:hypothetical protein